MAALAVCTALVASCGRDGDEDQLKADVDSFAVHYFNWRYQDAVPYCTEESLPWLRFAASNVHQEDVDSLRAMDSGAACSIDAVDYTSDSTATVRLKVENFLHKDTIGGVSHLVEAASVELPLVYRDKWKVHLKALPRVR